jgi:prolyl-tRNA synthetase
VTKAADKLYDELNRAGIEVIYDDRDESAGVKFANADLIGVPVRLTVSRKTVAEDQVEWKNRTAQESKMIRNDKVVEAIKNS